MAPSKAMMRFRADIRLATEKDYGNITNIHRGDVEDEFTFTFHHPNLPPPSQFEVHAQSQDARSYPGDNSFLIYTNDDVSPAVARILEESMFVTTGMKVDNMLVDLSQRLRTALESDMPDEKRDVVMTGADTDADADDLDMEDAYSDSEDELFEYDDYDYGSGNNFPPSRTLAERDSHKSLMADTFPPPILNRFRRDLRSVLLAGFHTGIVYGLSEDAPSGIVSISIRVNKLCLPKATREAWDLLPSEYVVLLIKYDCVYKTFEDVLDKPVEHAKMRFCLRKCPKQKPSTQQAVKVFAPDSPGEINKEEPESPELSNLWISKSMDDFMNSEFIALLKTRTEHDLSWEKAKDKLRSQMMQSTEESEDARNMGGKGESNDEARLPALLADDHFLSAGERSLPLIAMQFALRYLVRCTDYCTVCHRKMKGSFAALMPYVCSAPLCLHQYINLGFGPSVDHQIINHPEVIDLLISFSYAALCTVMPHKVGMRNFPTGLGLRVPRIRTPTFDKSRGQANDTHVLAGSAFLVNPITIEFNWKTSVATVIGYEDLHKLGVGQWIVISTKARELNVLQLSSILLHHACIKSISGNQLYLNVVSRHSMPDSTHVVENCIEGVPEYGSPETLSGHLVLCNEELDNLDQACEKAFSMIILLASMPSVEEMRSYLMSSRKPLAKWDRMSPASVDLLRWIIASNRSHIVKVDEPYPDSKFTRHPEMIDGVDGWIQFRFTQGSPEKENLFYEALEQVTHPGKTLVAWHGSSLGNWHSIVREGLDYNATANGRAYGDGIYFARDFDTSQSYACVGRNSGMIWPRSKLKVEGVISLNELVNLPNEFRNQIPYFVVQHCHWTQCRYLFVKPHSTYFTPTNNGANPSNGIGGSQREDTREFKQDPNWAAKGPCGTELFIPEDAMPSMQRIGRGSFEEKMDESELHSSDEDEKDTEFIWNEEQVTEENSTADTDFRPGTLDFSTLPQLAPPSYATNAAQRALGQEIKKLEKVQSSTPLHLLGWYINFEKLNNLFQWIVELHSFDSNLPLAKDMKNADLTSIVLEMRFLRGFPISPPFVRVIRPRLLPFMNGGGGHVTSGGALCMELLTNSGWSPANSLESVILQVRMAICSEEPRPARLQNQGEQVQGQYGIREAIEAYRRAAATHGWEVPADLTDASLLELSAKG